ncbi:MAG: GDSL-type esterase/lipase family protein, partial [Alistipes sp.]
MKRMFLFLLLLPVTLAAQQQTDWANFGRYAKANYVLEVAPTVVFMGNSITDGWDDAHESFFALNNYACRGISGQVSAQMLSRFRADVIELHPLVVVILAGTNDLALNNGYIASEHIVENIASMAELAEASGIRPILCSVLPAKEFPWRKEVKDVALKIRGLNSRLRLYAAERGYTWVEYYEPMAAKDGSLKGEYTTDGVHPNA